MGRAKSVNADSLRGNLPSAAICPVIVGGLVFTAASPGN